MRNENQNLPFRRRFSSPLLSPSSSLPALRLAGLLTWLGCPRPPLTLLLLRFLRVLSNSGPLPGPRLPRPLGVRLELDGPPGSTSDDGESEARGGAHWSSSLILDESRSVPTYVLPRHVTLITNTPVNEKRSLELFVGQRHGM